VTRDDVTESVGCRGVDVGRVRVDLCCAESRQFAVVVVQRRRGNSAVSRENPEVVVGAGAQTAPRERRVDVPRDLGGRRGRYAAVEGRPLAVNDRHVGQRQLEDVRKERRTELTHHLDVFVGDLLGCGRRDGKPLDMGQHTGRCRLHPPDAVHPRPEPAPPDDVRPAGR